MNQLDYWNGRAGETWTAQRDNLDRMPSCTAAVRERGSGHAPARHRLRHGGDLHCLAG